MSAVYNPHLNLRAESAVKTAKRMSPHCDLVARALLQHRNTPMKGLGLSPAQLLFGRSIKDQLGGIYKTAETWITCREQGEQALRRRVSLGGERWAEQGVTKTYLMPASIHPEPESSRELGQDIVQDRGCARGTWL